MTKDEMPIGFAMALAMNPDAMKTFATLSEKRKKEIIAGTHTITSKDEMRRYVDALVTNQQ